MYYNVIILILTNIILNCAASNSNNFIRNAAVIPAGFIVYVMHKGVRKKLDIKKWNIRDMQDFIKKHAAGQLLDYCICQDNYGNLYAVLKSKYIERVTLEEDILGNPLYLNGLNEEFLKIHSMVPEYREYLVNLNNARAIVGHYHSCTIFDYVMEITRSLHANESTARLRYDEDYGNFLMMKVDNSSIHYYVLPLGAMNMEVLSQLLEQYSLQRNKAYTPKKINDDKKDIKTEDISKTPINVEKTSPNNSTIITNNNENNPKNISPNIEIPQNNNVNNQNINTPVK